SENNIVEIEKLGAIAVGFENPEDYTDKRKVSFYSLKGVLDDIFERLGINVRYIPANLKGFFEMRTARIMIDDKEIGVLGMIDPNVLDMYDVKDEVYFFEIDLETLYRLKESVPEYKPTPKYPYIRRDVSFLIPFGFESSKIIEELKKGSFVEKVGVSDIYKGKGIPQDNISVTFYVIFRSKERTLTDDEVNDLFQNMVENIEKKLGVKKRY
ncbi:MAG TPA: phenylalanine--tRNA ligase subunit beta, partial [Thermotoga sp.]|nr:phenylalanine--tRNA ligase subunit beta [Thermotoga sp.]